LVIKAKINFMDVEDEKKGIKISSTTCSALRSQRDRKPSRSGPGLPTHLLSKPKCV
jgi:hypothetical protein